MVYWQLFLSFFKIGLFAIGGAYSFLPLTEREIVEKYHWLSRPEFLDISGFVKIFPGAISVKYATYTGYKIAGIPGAAIANLANLLAPAICVMVMSFFYFKFRETPAVKGAFHMIQLVIFAMIIAVAFQTVDVTQLVRLQSVFIIVVAFSLFIYSKIDPAIIIVVAGLMGALLKLA